MEEKETECTESLYGMVMLRKLRNENKDVWVGTVGNTIVSRGTFESKEKLIEDMERIDLEGICRLIGGCMGAIINRMQKEEKL